MKYSDVDVLNFIDGRFNDEQTAEFLVHMRTDPELETIVRAMQASQLPIEEAYRQQPLPSVPSALREQLESLSTESTLETSVRNSSNGSANDSFGNIDTDTRLESEQLSHNMQPLSNGRMGKLTAYGLAACLFSGIGLGAFTTQQYLNINQSGLISMNPDSVLVPGTSTHNRLVKRIADYQSLYVEKTVAKLSESRVEHAMQLLNSTGLNNEAWQTMPDYSSFGYEFARAQELGFEGETLVQLVYRKPGSAPLALCLMPSNSETQTLPMGLSKHHELNVASWITESQHYVLVADESDAVLEKMVVTVTAVN